MFKQGDMTCLKHKIIEKGGNTLGENEKSEDKIIGKIPCFVKIDKLLEKSIRNTKNTFRANSNLS